AYRKRVFASEESGGNSERGAQELRRKISAIRPDDCAQLRVKPESTKVLRVSQRFEHFAVQLGGQIQVPLGSIVEP
ncbi:MAG: hypothetical protein WCF44_12985, partial [Candidatus Methylophosphatis roskildensis]